MEEAGKMKTLTLEEAAIFHGHLGPFLTLGYIAGKEAVKRVESKSPFEIKAIITCPQETPYTCFIDGVQCSTLCTMGKCNISSFAGSGITLKLEKRDGKTITIKVREEVIEKIRNIGLEEGARWVLEQPLEKLFIILEE
ncbi:MAG: hypothetical protein DRJ39_03845 [Thermoprotei archaeon]|nr:MAG: hypothetical protein DRJ39_03845 [Thermoprotei archaeon]